MNSNYEWQKHQANERVQARLQEAEAHRQAKQAGNQSSFPPLLKLMIPILTGVIFAIWLLTSCTPLQDTKAGAEASSDHLAVTMADRIRFQDEQDRYLWVETAVVSEGPTARWTMADRIRFQDRIEERRSSGTQ